MSRFTSEQMSQIPVLRKGKGSIGAEYAGCSGTGKRVLIMHSKLGYYVVGTELDVNRALTIMRLGIPKGHKITQKEPVKKWNEERTNYKVVYKKRTIAWVYKGRPSAVKKFHELNQQVLDFNARVRGEVAEQTVKAKRGDVEAIINLGLDYGITV